jgi:AcrR family transcriptional regulator
METKRGETGQQDTAARIMSLMADLALEKGLDALSMRDVAKRVGISLASLQYHYPSKDALIAAFVDSVLGGFRADVAALRGAADPAEELRAVVTYAVARTLDERTGDIFAMLEARARHDAATAAALDAFMRVYLDTARDVLRHRHPDLAIDEATRAAVRLVAVIEGLSSVRSAAQAAGLGDEDLRKAVVSLAEAASTTAHPSQPADPAAG